MNIDTSTCYSNVFDAISKSYSVTENDSSCGFQKEFSRDEDSSDEELQEVFSDHIFMNQRLKKRLYIGGLDQFKDLPKHPPIALTSLTLELFSKTVPNYGLGILDMDYVASVSEATRISPCAMILAMIYLERLQVGNSKYLETVSPSDLFVITMLVASKFLFDNEEDMVSNEIWADALNFDVKDLNRLESEFLSAIEWRAFVDSSVYFQSLSKIETVVAVRQSMLHGWLSYTDMYVIIQDVAFHGFWFRLLKRILKMTFLLTVGYVASALMVYGISSLVFSKEPSAISNSSSSILQKNTSHLLLSDSVYKPEISSSRYLSNLQVSSISEEHIIIRKSDGLPCNTFNKRTFFIGETIHQNPEMITFPNKYNFAWVVLWSDCNRTNNCIDLEVKEYL